MQRNISQVIGRFIIKYIWLLCALLIVLECASTTYSSIVLIERASAGVMESIKGEVSSRVDNTLKLITSLSKHPYIADTNKSEFERAVFARAFQESYNLFMIAVTDEEGYVSSSDETEPPDPSTQYNLMYRDYMQRLYNTGTYQITDPIVSGSDHVTVNYTIAVPILQDGVVKGSVFGSIYFDEIQNIISRSAEHQFTQTYLFGREHSLIVASEERALGTHMDSFWENAVAFGLNNEIMQSNMEKGVGGAFWVLDTEGLEYVLYDNVAPTEWTLAYSTNFLSMMMPLLPAMLLKILLYILMSFGVSVLSRRSLKRQLSSVNQLLDTMSNVHRRFFQDESSDYTTMLEITCEGLEDRLTGLSTRTLFHNKLSQWNFETQTGAIIFVDLDCLKQINDGYGHEAGDSAIQLFGQVLKQFEAEHDAVAARYGGDEFIVVVNTPSEQEVKAFCEQLTKEMHRFIEVSDVASSQSAQTNRRVDVHASIGAALYPQHGNKAEDLICKADLAMYEAKRRGKGCWVIYSDDMI